MKINWILGSGPPNNGKLDETKLINCTAIDGDWSEFGEWKDCNKSCHQIRNRSCSDPSPAYGGEECEGPEYQTQFCISGDCPGHDCYKIGRYTAGKIYLLVVFVFIGLQQSDGSHSALRRF